MGDNVIKDLAAWRFLHDCLVALESIFSFFPENFPRPKERLDIYLQLYTQARRTPKLKFIQNRVRRVIVRYCASNYRLSGKLQAFEKIEALIVGRFNDKENLEGLLD